MARVLGLQQRGRVGRAPMVGLHMSPGCGTTVDEEA